MARKGNVHRDDHEVDAGSPTTAVAHDVDLDRASKQLKFVSDPSRLQIMMLLAGGERHVTDVCKDLDQSQPEISQQLILLNSIGLIEAWREGQDDFCRLTSSGSSLVNTILLLSGPGAIGPFPPDRLPEELREEVAEVTDDPEGWMRTPNPQFEGRRPVDLLGTPDEPRILRVIRAAQQGFFA